MLYLGFCNIWQSYKAAKKWNKGIQIIKQSIRPRSDFLPIRSLFHSLYLIHTFYYVNMVA